MVGAPNSSRSRGVTIAVSMFLEDFACFGGELLMQLTTYLVGDRYKGSIIFRSGVGRGQHQNENWGRYSSSSYVEHGIVGRNQRS
jgi:hypothetical protein